MRARLIVNADDLGRTPGVNRGIVRAHREGVVRSATLLVNYPASAEGAEFARACAELGVGLHLALSGGPPALPAGRIPGLARGGALPRKPEEGLAEADPDELRAEARAQLERFERLMGRPPTHIDTHHHSHRIPAVLDVVVELAQGAGVPVRRASSEVARRLEREGVATTDRFCEEFFGERARLDTLLELVAAQGPGSCELMCHPAEVDDELRRGSGYAGERAAELAALIDPRLKDAIEAAGVELTHFGRL